MLGFRAVGDVLTAWGGSVEMSLVLIAGAMLQASILICGRKTKLDKKYPLFFSYIGIVFVIELTRFAYYRLTPSAFPLVYWQTELVLVLAGYAVAFEIFKRTLEHNPGIARTGQRLLVAVLLFALSYAGSELLHNGYASVPRAIADLGRYLLYVESILLVLMLWAFGRYRIRFGPNLLGLTLGYAVLVAVDISNLALLSTPGNEDSVMVRTLIPATHFVVLVIWGVSVWSVRPGASPPAESSVDRDYARLVTRTRSALGHVSAHIGRTLRP